MNANIGECRLRLYTGGIERLCKRRCIPLHSFLAMVVRKAMNKTLAVCVIE